MFQVRSDRYPPPVPFCLLFRNPEFGHELGTKSAEDNVASGGTGIVIAAIVGRGSFHRTSMLVRAMPPTRSRTRPAANAVGDPIITNSPNTKSHTGIIAVRLNNIDMVVILLSSGGSRTTHWTNRRRVGFRPRRAILWKVEFDTSYVCTRGVPSTTCSSGLRTAEYAPRAYVSAFAFRSHTLMPTASVPPGAMNAISSWKPFCFRST